MSARGAAHRPGRPRAAWRAFFGPGVRVLLLLLVATASVGPGAKRASASLDDYEYVWCFATDIYARKAYFSRIFRGERVRIGWYETAFLDHVHRRHSAVPSSATCRFSRDLFTAQGELGREQSTLRLSGYGIVETDWYY